MASMKSLISFGKMLPKMSFLSKYLPAINLSGAKQTLYSWNSIHTSAKNCDLMEFFDDKKNWNESEIQVGRAWKKDEMRIKSNSDLHKLWFVLLKERNMLLTMEQECLEQIQLFPNPERIDKVQESMRNLETVVRERNIAYHMLETGESGERPAKLVPNQLGIKYYYKMSEHLIPRNMNTHFKNTVVHTYGGYAVNKFLLHYREKLYNVKRRARNREYQHVQQLIKRFPNMDINKLKMEYPDVDIEKAGKQRRARGHFVLDS